MFTAWKERGSGGYVDNVCARKLRMVKGRYDLCESTAMIDFPQKSCAKISDSFELGFTSGLLTIASVSSKTNAQYIAFR